MDTYEDALSEGNSQFGELPNSGTGATIGRPRKQRIPYRATAKRCRVECNAGHELLPRFVGRWFPRNNDANGNNELYGASILLLLKPWRELSDLKSDQQSFTQGLADFLAVATIQQRDMVKTIQYYHDCWDVAQKRRTALRQGETFRLFDYEREGPTEELGTYQATYHTMDTIDEDLIEEARLKQRDGRDRLFANQAVQLAH